MKEKTKRGLKVKPNITRTTLKITAGDRSGFPNDKLVQIALSGRSNVGKSSLINTLIQRTGYARVSQTPGKTITVNFYEVDGRMYIVDLPGYGFARVSKTEKDTWDKMMGDYFTQSEMLKCVIILMDIRHEPTAEDKAMVTMCEYYAIPYIIVATKADKIAKSKRKNECFRLKRVIPSSFDYTVLPISNEDGYGKEALLDAIERKLTE